MKKTPKEIISELQAQVKLAKENKQFGVVTELEKKIKRIQNRGKK